MRPSCSGFLWIQRAESMTDTDTDRLVHWRWLLLLHWDRQSSVHWHWLGGVWFGWQICACVRVRDCVCFRHTWGQQDNRGDNQGTDDEDDQQGDGNSFPVPLWRCAAHQVLEINISNDNDAQTDTHTYKYTYDQKPKIVVCGPVLTSHTQMHGHTVQTHTNSDTNLRCNTIKILRWRGTFYFSPIARTFQRNYRVVLQVGCCAFDPSRCKKNAFGPNTGETSEWPGEVGNNCNKTIPLAALPAGLVWRVPAASPDSWSTAWASAWTQQAK